jgi:hypothetical protein
MKGERKGSNKLIEMKRMRKNMGAEAGKKSRMYKAKQTTKGKEK